MDFAEAVQRIDSHLRDEIERLETSRKQIAQLAAGDSLALPRRWSPISIGFGVSASSERYIELSGTGGSWSRPSCRT